MSIDNLARNNIYFTEIYSLKNAMAKTPLLLKLILFSFFNQYNS